jgi:gluconokinase
LKKSYRRHLRSANEDLQFVYLEGDFELIWSRMQARLDHYMKPEMLQSQFEALEIPEDALKVNIKQPISRILEEIIRVIG